MHAGGRDQCHFILISLTSAWPWPFQPLQKEIWEDWMLLPEGSIAYIEGLITGHSCVEHATAPIFAVLLLRKRIF